MNMSINFTPRFILNKISYSSSMTTRVIKSDGKSILLLEHIGLRKEKS